MWGGALLVKIWMMGSRQPVCGDQVGALKQNEYPFVSPLLAQNGVPLSLEQMEGTAPAMYLAQLASDFTCGETSRWRWGVYFLRHDRVPSSKWLCAVTILALTKFKWFLTNRCSLVTILDPRDIQLRREYLIRVDSALVSKGTLKANIWNSPLYVLEAIGLHGSGKV